MFECLQRPGMSFGVVRAKCGQQFEHLLFHRYAACVKGGSQVRNVFAVLDHIVQLNARCVHFVCLYAERGI